MTIAELTVFFGWLSAINLGLLVIIALCVVTLQSWIKGIHQRMFKLSDEQLSKLYFQYLAAYKLATIVLCLTPYFALRIMQS
ncbi:MAG: hypothetical protein DHS20C11_02460 [Lysobacteraceae bacterium]|nr:MAG: hypothetical protein DHS20C11_02460 [Xanthomonadaceae bacterium]